VRAEWVHRRGERPIDVSEARLREAVPAAMVALAVRSPGLDRASGGEQTRVRWSPRRWQCFGEQVDGLGERRRRSSLRLKRWLRAMATGLGGSSAPKRSSNSTRFASPARTLRGRRQCVYDWSWAGGGGAAGLRGGRVGRVRLQWRVRPRPLGCRCCCGAGHSKLRFGARPA
jgi:hypothetical protein